MVLTSQCPENVFRFVSASPSKSGGSRPPCHWEQSDDVQQREATLRSAAGSLIIIIIIIRIRIRITKSFYCVFKSKKLTKLRWDAGNVSLNGLKLFEAMKSSHIVTREAKTRTLLFGFFSHLNPPCVWTPWRSHNWFTQLNKHSGDFFICAIEIQLVPLSLPLFRSLAHSLSPFLQPSSYSWNWILCEYRNCSECFSW